MRAGVSSFLQLADRSRARLGRARSNAIEWQARTRSVSLSPSHCLTDSDHSAKYVNNSFPFIPSHIHSTQHCLSKSFPCTCVSRQFRTTPHIVSAAILYSKPPVKRKGRRRSTDVFGASVRQHPGTLLHPCRVVLGAAMTLRHTVLTVICQFFTITHNGQTVRATSSSVIATSFSCQRYLAHGRRLARKWQHLSFACAIRLSPAHHTFNTFKRCSFVHIYTP